MKTSDLKIYKETKIMKKIIVCLLAIIMVVCLVGCTESEKVQYNITHQADNFNIVRRITVINCITGDVLFKMEGKMSITADTADNQLEVLVEDNGTYCKHFIGLSDNVTYVIEDLNLGANDVNKYRYTILYNPNMWVPVEVESVD